MTVSPGWQQQIAVTYQGTPIQGIYFHNVRFRNAGNRSVQKLPVTISVSPNAVIAWPIATPQACLGNVQFPFQYQLVGEIDFINPKENVDICFWAFNDTVGTVNITARAPDVEFKSGVARVWETPSQMAFRIGVLVNRVCSWIGLLVLAVLIIYVVYRAGFYVYHVLKTQLG